MSYFENFDQEELWEEGLGAVDYTAKFTVLSDFSSPVAVNAYASDQIGIAQLFLKGLHMHSEYPLFYPALRLFIDSGNGMEPVGVSYRKCWPGGWREHGRTDDVEIIQDVFFNANHSLSVQWKFRNIKGKDTYLRNKLRAAIGGGLYQKDAVLGGRLTTHGLEMKINVSGNNMLSGKDFLINMNFNIKSDYPVLGGGFKPNASPATLQAFEDELCLEAYPLKGMGYWQELSLTDGTVGEMASEVELAWSFGDLPIQESSKSSLESSLNRWREKIPKTPMIQPYGYFWRRKYLQAYQNILSSLINAPGYGNYARETALMSSPVAWPSTGFFWDTIIGCIPVGLMDPELQVETIISHTKYMQGGGLPWSMTNAFPKIEEDTFFDSCYAPIATWGICKLWNCSNKEPALEKIYPVLVQLNQRWFEIADKDGDGIPEWSNSGHPADDSPLYDRYRPDVEKYATCFNIPPHLSVSLCSYLLMDMRCLEKIAAHLGKTEEAIRWKEKADWMDGILINKLWNPDEKIFYDFDTTSAQFTKVKTFFNLLPLWAGVSLPIEEIRQAIEKHLLNHDEMWGNLPFPSTAYNEPTYDPYGYWRGRIWPHVYFWNTEILSKYGYLKEADIAKNKFLSIIAHNSEISENMASDPSRLLEVGFPCYSFGTGTLIHFLLDWHKKPISF